MRIAVSRAAAQSYAYGHLADLAGHAAQSGDIIFRIAAGKSSIYRMLKDGPFLGKRQMVGFAELRQDHFNLFFIQRVFPGQLLNKMGGLL